jgi:aminopeptidase N
MNGETNGEVRPVRLEDYRPPPFLVERVDLYVDLREDHAEVRARLALRRNPEGAPTPDLRLDGEGLEPVRFALDGAPLQAGRWRIEDGDLVVADVPESFELETVCRIRPQENTALEGLYRSGEMFFTQCEAEGFRRITWYPDRPDVLARFRVTVEAERERYPVLLSNGNRVGGGERPGGRHYAVWEDPFPKPCYLFALVAGDLVCRRDRFVTRSGREVDLELYVEAHNAGRTAFALESLKQAMRWDEQRFGLEYDLDVYMIVAVDDFNMGAMENKGLNLFNAHYVLADPRTATDEDYLGIEAVVGHEYFHNWTGNRVTLRDWFQLSLKEGLTVFREQEFTAERTSAPVKRIRDVRLLRAQQFAEDAGPMAHPVRPRSYLEINNFYTLTVYEKGAELVRMVQTLVGREGFRRGLRLYLERHDGRAATVEDFLAAMAEANGRDFGRFLRWYEQAGTPELRVTDAWDPRTGTYTLHLRQRTPPTPGQPRKDPVVIPVVVGLLDGAGRELPLRGPAVTTPGVTETTLVLEEAEARFVFEGLPERPVPSLLRRFSAPVKLDYDYDDAALAHLLAHDSDGFNRWEAGQRLALRVLLAAVKAVQRGEPVPVPGALARALDRVLADAMGDPAWTAEALTLPGEAYLSEWVSPVDPQAIHAAREAVLAALARAHEGALRAVLEAMRPSEPYRYEPEAAALRRLAGVALGWLLRCDARAHGPLAETLYAGADNMTARIMALEAAHPVAGGLRERLLEDFGRRFGDEPLVLDKWFSLQATVPEPGALERVRRLMEHPVFDLGNPNRVRALIGAYAHRNPVGFHREDGAGYRFVADVVLELDPRNPQIAARLARAFLRWREYREPLGAGMREALERLAAARLSRDTYEIVTRSLAPGD